MEKQASAGFWLSPQQTHLWSQPQDGAPYRAVLLAAVEGALKAEAVRQALGEVVSRHEILRTVFQRQAGMKVPFQVVLEESEIAWQSIDLSAIHDVEQQKKLEELFQQEQVRRFDAEHGPVLSAIFAILGTNRAALLLSVPAVCGDLKSLGNLLGEVGYLCAGQTEGLNPEPLRYVQFAQWQKDLLESGEESALSGREFWKKQEAAQLSAPVLPLEIKTEAAFNPEAVSSAVQPSQLQAMEAVAKKYDVSLSDLLLAGWQAVLWRYTGQPSFAAGVYFDGREYEELQDALGPFGKTLPVPARFEGELSFRETLGSDAVRHAAEWQEYYGSSDAAATQPEIHFSFQELRAKQQFGPFTFAPLRQYACLERYKLKLNAMRHGDELTLEFHYDPSRLERSSVERIAESFVTLLAAAVAHPEIPVSRLPLLSEREQQRLTQDWNQTSAAYPKDQCFHQLFAAQAARTPDRPAVRFEDRVLSYRQLNEQSNQLAHYLRSLGVGPDSLVGLCLERSAEMMVAVLAILKAGGAYVPLNPDTPKPRLAQQLHGAVALLTDQKLLAQMPEFSGKTICLDRDNKLWTGQPTSDPNVNTAPENLVYVIYTSGSTGVPKGVAVRHRNLVNYSYFITQRLELDRFPDGLHFATVSTMGADLGNTCIFPALISGGCLHVIAYEVSTDPERLSRYCQRYPIDVLKIVPSHLEALLHSASAKQLLPRQYLITGGEALLPRLVEKIQSLGGSCRLLNHYGPTETTVGSLTLRLAECDWKTSTASTIPLGRPIANTQVYILDAQQQPVPVGVVGELYIAGDGVTAGYLNQPERTAERFLKNPFVSDPKATMYRTGDLARYLADGNVEFLGRGDDQVKIRGFRIELGEIETVLGQHASVQQAAVLAREDQQGDKRLVGYVVLKRDAKATSDDLRAYLKQQLPDYMVPQALVLLPKLPLNANGKLDRQALPAPEQVATKAYVAPRTPIEEVVANVWAEVLRKDRISTDDNFFDLGGHSLMATQIVSRVREHFHVELPMRILFEQPTITGLAQAIQSAQDQGGQSTDDAIVPVSRDAYRAGRT